MHLSSLEMQGFKSFPERTLIEFHQGITAIVGPNGSGKSNVTDAIRWVLGEQSARSLRGDKMEDIVFNGTANRRAMGYAEVAINLDNSDQLLPVEYEHVRIVRRYYRSGESEYLINQTVCRLKDIISLLMDTGIGRDGYSLVSQGKVDEILSSRSEDRRRVFDEASGIVKFKTRKEEAKRKLAQTDANLLRINDIAVEISNRLPELKCQAEIAKDYLELAKEHDELDIALLLEQIESRSTEAKKLKINVKQLAEDIISSEADIAAIRKRNEELDSSSKEKEDLLDNIRSKHQDKLEQLSLLKNNSGLLQEQNKHLAKEEQEAEAEKERIERNKDLLEAEKETREHKRKVLERQREAFLGQLEQVEGEFAAVLEKMDLQAKEQDQRRQDLSAAREEIFASDTIIARNESEIEILQRQSENLKELENKLNLELESLQRGKEKLLAEIKANEKLIVSSESESKKKDQLLQTKIQNIALLDSEKQQNLQNIRDLEYQQETLKKLEDSLEGYQAPVKKIMQKISRDESFAPDVKGPLGSLVEVLPEYEIAIEVAMGASSNHIVTESKNSAQKIISWLKDSNSGRATFLPIEVIKARKLEEKILATAQGQEGYLGLASEIIDYPTEIKGIVGNILGRTIVCENLTQALALAEKLAYRVRIVSLAGEIISPGGSITGGSMIRYSSGIIGRSGKIIKLGRQLEDIFAQDQELDEKLELARDELRQEEEESDQILKTIQEIQKLNNNLWIQTETIEHDQAKLEADKEQNEEMKKSLASEIFELTEEIEQKRKARNEENLLLQKLAEKIEQESSLRETDKERRDELRERLTDLKISVGSVEQSLAGIMDFVTHLKEQGKADEEKKEKLTETILAAGRLKLENEIKLASITKEIDLINSELGRFSQDVEEISQEREELQQEKQRLYKSLETQTESLAAIKVEHGRVDESLIRLEQNTDLLKNRLWEDYELTFANANKYRQELSSPQKSQRRLNQIKVQIKELGLVNTAAVSEYEALVERFEFLSRQKEDIEKSRSELTGLIAELDQAMEEQFDQYFCQISANFDLVFKELFGGGQAELILADEEDLLATDILIKAQPPGKRLQNLSLLSGGERSLTAIALLFAIFKLKPAPFCVFDEIESTLDDANVLRFTDYLKRYADETQFILVTHRKGTMEAAERLYGVTMQERGVSSIYSLKLADYQAG